MINLGQRLINSVNTMGTKLAKSAFTMGQRAIPIMNTINNPITQAVAQKVISVLEKSNRRKRLQ